MSGLDLLGADGLATQYVTFRVLKIDQDKLRQKVGGSAGALASFGISVANAQPRMAIDALIPVAISKARSELGIELEASRSEVPPKIGQPRGMSEFWPGLAIGFTVGGMSLIIWKKVLAPLGSLLVSMV